MRPKWLTSSDKKEAIPRISIVAEIALVLREQEDRQTRRGEDAQVSGEVEIT